MRIKIFLILCFLCISCISQEVTHKVEHKINRIRTLEYTLRFKETYPKWSHDKEIPISLKNAITKSKIAVTKLHRLRKHEFFKMNRIELLEHGKGLWFWKITWEVNLAGFPPSHPLTLPTYVLLDGTVSKGKFVDKESL